MTMAIAEQAIAFMCTSGSGVSSRSAPSRSAHSPPTLAYHSPARRKYAFDSTHPLGRPVVPDV